MKRLLVLLLLATVTVAYASDAKQSGDNPRVSPDLRKWTAPTARVVVQYNNPPSLLD